MRLSKVMLVFLVVSFIVLLSINVSAEILGERFIENSSSTTGITTSAWRAQIFTVGSTGINAITNVSNVSFMYYKVISGTLFASIKAVDGSGQPFGEDIFNGSRNTSNIGGLPLSWINISMIGNGSLLQANTKYGLVIKQLSGDGEFGINSTGSYSGGNWSRNDTGLWISQNGDAPFMIFTIDAKVYPFLYYPSSGSTQSNISIIFNSTATPVQYNLTNATLYVWNSSGVFNTTTLIVSGIVTNESIFNLTGFKPTNYHWNVLWCVLNSSSSFCKFADLNFTFSYSRISFIYNTYNVSTYETSLESFTTNLTVIGGQNISSATFYYSNTTYSGLVTQYANSFLLSKTINIPLGSATSNWFWKLTYTDNLQENITINTQDSATINFSYCTASAPQNNPYLNFTFKDENSQANINATVDSSGWKYYLGSGTVNKSLTFANLVTNVSYAFCFTPSNRSLNVYLSNFKYSNTNYPQRNYAPGNINLTSTVTDRTLYLLGSASGIYSSVVVYQGAGNIAVVGATVQVELLLSSGSYVTVGYGTTDDSGTVSFWVNPNSQYRYTVSASGYNQQQATISPSQTAYIIRLSATGSSGNAYNSSLVGYKWYVLPQIGMINASSNTYTLNLTSYITNLYSCRFSILDENQNILNTTTGGSSSGCLLTLTYTSTDDQRIYGRLEINNTLTIGLFQIVDTDWGWISISDGRSTWLNIGSFFTELTTLSEFGGTDYKRDFSRIMFFFLMATIFMALFAFFTGFDLQSPGSMIIVIWFIIAFGSLGGFLQINSISTNINPWFKSYAILIIYSLFALGYIFKLIKRQA